MRRLLLAALGLVAGAACGSSSPGASATSRPSPVESAPAWADAAHAPAPGLPYEGDWVLVSAADPEGAISLDDDYPITLTMHARSAGGRATCNGYGGKFKIDGTAYVPGTWGADQAGCVDKELETTETRYFETLMTIREVDADESTLRLTGPGVELVFERIPPIDLDALVDRTWKVRDHTLRLSSDRTFRITYGCDVLEGEWDAMAGRIYMPEARLTEDCPGAGADDVPLDVSSGDFTVDVEGNRLTITHGGKSIVYRSGKG